MRQNWLDEFQYVSTDRTTRKEYLVHSNLLCARVVFGPDADELIEVVGAEDGGVPRQVVKVVHDDGDEEIEHDEGAEEDEGDKVEVRDGRSAGLLRVEDLPRRGVVPVRPRVTLLTACARQHDVGPRFACSTSAKVTVTVEL